MNKRDDSILPLTVVLRFYTGVMGNTRELSPSTVEALAMLGARVRLGRLERRWRADELAERVGVSPTTIRKVERGDPTVALGTALEAAAIVGVALFHVEQSRRAIETEFLAARLAVLPATTRRPPIDDNF